MRAVPPLLLALALLAGCGAAQTRATRTATIPSYGGFAPETITIANPDPESLACRRGAQAVAAESSQLLYHSGNSAYPADLYWIQMRHDLVVYRVRRCSRALLGRILGKRLNDTQRGRLLRALPAGMAATLRASLDEARGSP